MILNRHMPVPAQRAFTLVEVMLALVVSAIVLAGVGGVFFSALRLRERTLAALDESLPLHQAFIKLRHDLQGAVPPGGSYAMAGDFQILPTGGTVAQSFRLHLYTTTGIVNQSSPWADMQEIVYELRDPTEPGKASGKDLYRTLNRNLLGTGQVEPEEQWLMGGVAGLQFSAYDGTDWRDSWDTSLGDTNLPSAVRVRILLASENKGDRQEPFEMVVPLEMQSRTNQTSSATNSP